MHAMTHGKPGSSAAWPMVAGVGIGNPDRVLYPESGLTKRRVAECYDRIGAWIVPHVEGRPLTLVRCPEGLRGDCFYMKHSKVVTRAARPPSSPGQDVSARS